MAIRKKMTREQKLKTALTKIKQKEFKKKRICLVNGCQENCIKSHLLQRIGILNQIAEKNHIYVLGQVDLFKTAFDKPLLQFKKMGIKAGMTLPLFCNKHDTEIFAPIEQDEYDSTDYQIQLIFSYRTICAELRKKQIQADIFGAIINDPTIRTELNLESLNKMIYVLNGFLYGIRDLNFYKEELEKDINKDHETPRFTFQTTTNNLIEVCTTASFSPMDYTKHINAEQEEPLNAVIINVFPKSNKTHVIIGYHNKHKSKWIEDYLKEWKDDSELEFQKRMSTLLVKRCETWAISETLFNSLGEKKRSQIINEFVNDVHSHSQNLKTEINLFEK